MQHFKKVLVLIIVSLGVGLIDISSTQVNAGASSWHRGLPTAVRKHALWADAKVNRFGSANQMYTRKYLRAWKQKKAAYFAEIAEGYYKTGRFSDGSVELLINAGHYNIEPVTAYRKVGKRTYELKSTLKQSGFLDHRYKLKVVGKTTTAWTKTVWNRIDAKRGLNVTQKKWHKLGKYKAMKNISDDSLENRDPLHK